MTKSVSINNKPTVEIDSSTPVEVNHSGDITIDTSTPLSTNANITNTNLDVTVQGTTDVNVTNATLATNATIQNASLDVNLTDLDVNSRLPVSVDNQPTVTVGNSNLDVTLQNSSINTNATIQNTNLDVTVQNAFQYVYDMVYDGAQWRFQLSDSNGKAISLSHTYYTSAEITALGSSTDINLWLAAYNDSMLQYKYVGSYDDQYEVEVYLTHPSLGDGNKCLKLIFDYSTQNSVKVVQSVFASIVDWTFDASVTGALTVTLGTVTSPDPSSAIAVGTDICTIAVSNTGQGTVTISLSGTNASLYTLRNVTDATTGSSLAYDPLKSYVLETASDFSGASYSHSVTITATNNLYGNTNSANVATSGTYSTPVSWSNEYYATKASSTNVYDPTYIKLTDSTITSFSSKAFSFSFWFKSNINYTNISMSTGGNTASHHLINTNTPAIALAAGYFIVIWGTALRIGRAYDASNAYRFLINGANNSMFDSNWHHIVIAHDGTTNASDNITDFTANHDVYIDTVLQTKSSAANFGNASTTNTYTDTDLYLGKYVSHSNFNNSNSCGLPYLGKIDECAYWANRKLSTNNNGVNEISLIYNSGTPVDLENTTNIPVPTTYFRFEDNTDLGFESVTNSNTTNELLLQQGSLTSGDSVYVPASGAWEDLKYAYMPASSLSGVGFSLSSTGSELSLWPSLGSGTNYFPLNTDSWAFSIWIKGNDVTSNYYNFLSMIDGSDAQIKFYANNNVIIFSINRDGNAGSVQVTYSSSNVLTNTWNQVIISKSGNTSISASDITMYVNGSSVTLGTGSNNYGSSTGLGDDLVAQVEIGGQLRSAVSGSFIAANTSLNYSVDELICFNTSINSTQAIELYNSGSSIDPSTLSFASSVDSYFRMGDNSSDNATNVTFVDNSDTARTFSKGYSGSQAINTH